MVTFRDFSTDVTVEMSILNTQFIVLTSVNLQHYLFILHNSERISCSTILLTITLVV